MPETSVPGLRAQRVHVDAGLLADALVQIARDAGGELIAEPKRLAVELGVSEAVLRKAYRASWPAWDARMPWRLRVRDATPIAGDGVENIRPVGPEVWLVQIRHATCDEAVSAHSEIPWACRCWWERVPAPEPVAPPDAFGRPRTWEQYHLMHRRPLTPEEIKRGRWPLDTERCPRCVRERWQQTEDARRAAVGLETSEQRSARLLARLTEGATTHESPEVALP